LLFVYREAIVVSSRTTLLSLSVRRPEMSTGNYYATSHECSKGYVVAFQL